MRPTPFISFSSDAQQHACTRQCPQATGTHRWLWMWWPWSFSAKSPTDLWMHMMLPCKRDTILQIEKQEYIAVWFEGIHSLPAVTNLLLLIADSFLAITYSTGLILHHIGNIVHICTSPSASSLIILLDRFLMQHIRFLFVEQTTQGISTTRFFHNCQPVNVRSEEDLDGEAGSH